MNQQDFGLRLKEFRQIKALTQSQLASKVGITRQALYSYESGKRMPSAEIISKLSQILGADLMGLLFEQATTTYKQSYDSITLSKWDDFFTFFGLYGKLSPLSQKRILKLMELMPKGGVE